jgi:hypothetical protein
MAQSALGGDAQRTLRDIARVEKLAQDVLQLKHQVYKQLYLTNVDYSSFCHCSLKSWNVDATKTGRPFASYSTALRAEVCRMNQLGSLHSLLR